MGEGISVNAYMVALFCGLWSEIIWLRECERGIKLFCIGCILGVYSNVYLNVRIR